MNALNPNKEQLDKIESSTESFKNSLKVYFSSNLPGIISEIDNSHIKFRPSDFEGYHGQ